MPPGKYREFWRGVRHGIRLCCIIWFVDVHCTKAYAEREEYQNRMNVLTGNAGVVLCPDCVAREVVVLRRLASRAPQNGIVRPRD